MTHTKEPWRAEKICEANYEIGHDHGTNHIEVTATAITESNARRIVACVNACSGIPLEALENGTARQVRDELQSSVRLKKQRDELLCAVRKAVVCCAHPSKEAAQEAYELLDEFLVRTVFQP